jgi:hypothetical protein
MLRLILICILFNFGIISYSQQEQVFLSKVLNSYNKEMPNLEHKAFRELRRMINSKEMVKKSELKKYHFIIIPMLKLKGTYVKYNYNDIDTFVKYIDFTKFHRGFDVFVFKDSIYYGSFYNYYSFTLFLTVKDTNKYNQQAFIEHKNLALQILKFKPEMVFYPVKDFEPDLALYPKCLYYVCLIKDRKLYINRKQEQTQPMDCILPFDKFVKKYPFFINDIKGN